MVVDAKKEEGVSQFLSGLACRGSETSMPQQINHDVVQLRNKTSDCDIRAMIHQGEISNHFAECSSGWEGCGFSLPTIFFSILQSYHK